AKIIIDYFHLVQLTSRAMNKMRIRVINALRTSNGEDMKKYRRLKRYWRLLLKYKKDLSYTEYKHYRLFGQRLEVNVVDELLSYHPNLKVDYEVYQALLESIKEKDFKGLVNILTTVKVNIISRYMKISVIALTLYRK